MSTWYERHYFYGKYFKILSWQYRIYIILNFLSFVGFETLQCLPTSWKHERQIKMNMILWVMNSGKSNNHAYMGWFILSVGHSGLRYQNFKISKSVAGGVSYHWRELPGFIYLLKTYYVIIAFHCQKWFSLMNFKCIIW